jgi:uracil-DNA glycosylase family 4
LVGESPGYDEVNEGEPFVGVTGERLDDALTDVRLPRSRLAVVNVMACQPTPGATDREKSAAMKACRPLFRAQVGKLLKAKAPVLAMGKWAVVRVSKLLGHPETTLSGRGFVRDGHFIATWHPTYAFFHNPWEAGVFLIDLDRFARMIRGELRPGPSLLLTRPTVADVARLLKEGLPVAVDIETAPAKGMGSHTGKMPGLCRLKTVGLGNKHWGLSIWWPTANLFLKTSVKVALLDERILKVFQNGYYFDIPVLKRYGLEVR